ncbi:30S ribosomal protein S2 [Candidatus Hydrogenedentota bacterium]
MPVVTMKNLLETGVHFGHQTRRWNPKMEKYIFGERNKIYILDLQRTLKCIKIACNFITDVTSKGQSVLFVGTKRQAQEPVKTEAERAGMYHVNHRWLGGMMTNHQTIRNSVRRMIKLQTMVEDGTMDTLSKKEASRLGKELTKLERNLTGVRDMEKLPGALFVVDTRKEAIAVAEANRLGISVVGVVDTNCDPDPITYPIPGNDDAIRAVKLYAKLIADAAIEGRASRDEGLTAPAESEDAEGVEETAEVQEEA